MKKVDYIVVGLGVAGICFCEELEKNKKSFIVIDNGQDGATANSGGVFNPTVLKRFNAAWNVSRFYPEAVSFYQNLSKKLGIQLFKETTILRVFRSVEEQNDWSVASNKIELEQFLSSKFLKNENPFINADLGFGEVLGTAQIDAISLLRSYRNYLESGNRIHIEDFDYGKIVINKDEVEYKMILSEKIIFCEGAGVLQNPFFPSDGIIPNKGEYLTFRAPKLNLNKFLKGPLYIIPLGDSLYKVGGTFDRDNYTTGPTIRAREEIISKLKSMITCPFEVVGQSAGVRPTTRDRKPLLGSFLENPRLVFLNGLGSRGFTMAPLLSQILYRNVEMGIPVPSEMDINRIKL